MITHEVADLGQLRVAGSSPDYYLQASYRPFPFKSEEDLIKEGTIRNTVPPWGSLDWPLWKTPPAVPSLENEAYHIKRTMVKSVWPHAATWNLNYQKGNWGTLPEGLSPTAEFQGIDDTTTQGPEHLPAVMGVAGGLVTAAIWSLIAYGIFRVIKKEDTTFWKVTLAAGGGLSAINAVSGLFVAGQALK